MSFFFSFRARALNSKIFTRQITMTQNTTTPPPAAPDAHRTPLIERMETTMEAAGTIPAHQVTEAIARLRELEAENAELRADKARLDWFYAAIDFQRNEVLADTIVCGLRAAIDAAIAQEAHAK
jgi:hypothetical protein